MKHLKLKPLALKEMLQTKARRPKPVGQSMVEFALALPVLLVLLYGSLETGRLLFIYSSTVTASRQAVRYGSATGIGPNGMPYYQDCTGIRAAVQNVGFINRFEDSNINIAYDRGLNNDGTVAPISNPEPVCGAYLSAQNGDRIKVRVATDWSPIVPILPFKSFTIVSETERTILARVDIQVTAVSSGWDGVGSGLADLVSVSPNTTTYATSGEVITYTYSLQNVGSGNLISPSVVDTRASTSCADSTVAAKTAFTCSGVYVVTQADLDNGFITNTAYPGTSPTDTVTTSITALQSPQLTLTKSASPTESSVVGAIITYTYILKNSGNVTLTAPYGVTDDKLPGVDCSNAASPLAPGASTTCMATYAVTASDINNGSIVNHATAFATFGSATVNSNTATATVLTPRIYLVISQSTQAVTAANQIITYTYNIKNLSSDTITSWSITDNRVKVNCSEAGSSIAAGSSTVCTGAYTVTQADMDAGISLKNTATASGVLNGQSVGSNTVTTVIAIAQTPAILATVEVVQSAAARQSYSTGDIISYTYVLTNSGNTTLKAPITITDNKMTITCADQSDLLPGGTRTCTGSYTVTAADMQLGSVANTGLASASQGATSISSPPVSATITTYSGPRFNIGISADKTIVTTSGEQIAYSYTFTNTGSANLSTYAITSSLGTSYPSSTLDCSLAAAFIAPGSFTTCRSTYTVTSSGLITNTVNSATAKNGGVAVSASNLPVSLAINSSMCDASNLRYTSFPSSIGNGNSAITWTISNTVGASLPISAIIVAWNNSGNSSGNHHLNSIVLSNSSSASRPGLPDNISSYISGSGSLNAGSTDITLTFSKNNPSGVSITIAFQSPYGNCHLP